MVDRRVIAIDLGASSGRVIGVSFADGRATIDAVHRFDNQPVEQVVGDAPRWCWDLDGLQRNIDDGIAQVAAAGEVDSIAVDSWGVDYGLVDDRGELVAPVTAYRDGRHHAAFDRLREQLGESVTLVGRWNDLVSRTGVAILESDDVSAVNDFCLKWTNVCDMKIAPVMNDEKVRALGKSRS